jgi:hypothetical protein
MTEHYTRNTKSVTQWCNECGCPTRHAVSAGRVGRCRRHQAKVRPRKPRSRQLSLFEPRP